MLIAEISIRRPVFATMLMIACLVVGVIGYRNLAVEELPNIEFPIAVVDITYPGASPAVIETEVIKKVEDAVNTVKDVKRITSTAYEGLSLTIIEFKLERNRDAAVQDIRDAIARIRRNLPDDIEEPQVRTYDPTAQPIMTLGLISDRLNVRELSDLAKFDIRKRLERSYGVGRINNIGEMPRQINIEPDPIKLKSKRIGIEQLIDTVLQNNQEIPIGLVEGQISSKQVRVKGRVEKPDFIGDLVIANRGGIPIDLKAVSDIRDGSAEPKSRALLNDTSIVAINVIKIPGTNSVKAAESIKASVKEINRELPKGTKLTIIEDQSASIKDSLHELTNSILVGVLLTILIVFVFLNSWRSTVITGLALPISLIATFGIMAALNFTLNTMTLIGLSLSVGLVIDDAIVVRENIIRHLDMGKNHFQAALDGTTEVGMAVLASTLTIVAVFVPVAFMQGITGLFFREFGITVATAVLVSLLVSFTLDPMLSSIWKDPRGSQNWLSRALTRFNRGFEDLALSYRHSVAWVLAHPLVTLMITALVFVGSCALVPLIGVAFVPDQDKGEISIKLKTPENSTLDYTTTKSKQVIAFLKANFPEIKYVYARIGGGFTDEVYEADLYVSIVPRERRSESQAEIVRRMRANLKRIAGVKAYISSANQAGPGQSPLQVSIQGQSGAAIDPVVQLVLERLSRVKGATDLDSSQKNQRNNLDIQIDRIKSADLGLNLSGISNTLRYVFAGREAGTWLDKLNNEYDIVVRLPKSERNSETNLKEIYLLSNEVDEQGLPVLVSMDEVAQIQSGFSATTIGHRDLLREVTISGNVQGSSPGQVIAEAKKTLSQIKLPPGVRLIFGGEAEDIDEASQYATQALLLAVIFIYLIMASQFNSFIQPLAIMFTLPLALIGVFITLFLTGDTLNLLSMIGVITLMGLVTKNGILLVEFANQRRNQGIDLKEALAEAGQIRLRPILMTSLATILGILPLAFGIGSGSELRAPMARAIAGGVVSSTLLTLFVIPVIYCLLDYGWRSFAGTLRLRRPSEKREKET
ncbi:MAG: efflux RND transporter permease subunit [Candidatus Caenarcaniphilales bacterium]|nr:efflux RND transporter permease subunit [Candidatus Caenarcaniphilales bacterium]